MLYLGIDQHRKQLTVCVRDERGDVTLRRQVSTEWERVRVFLAEIRTRGGKAGWVAIVEVCGFNDWLVRLLDEYGCREVLVIQPEKRSKKKTDRRDANALGELLWVNRERLLAGKRVQGVRRICPPTEGEAEDRQLTELRKRLGQLRTRTINGVKHLLRKHNLEQECPTKGIDTIKAKKWLATLPLSAMDRLQMDLLLTQWKLWDEQIKTLEAEITRRQAENKTAAVKRTKWAACRGRNCARRPREPSPNPDTRRAEMTCSRQSIRAGISPASCRRAGGRGPSPCTPYPLLRSRAEDRVASWDRQQALPHVTRKLAAASLLSPNQTNHCEPTDYGCIGPSLAEEALAGKASLRWPLDLAPVTKRLSD